MSEDDYADVTPLQWAEYEFATIEYDNNISPKAAQAIRAIFVRLAESPQHYGLFKKDL